MHYHCWISLLKTLLGIIPQSIVADIAEADSVVTGEKREGMFFAARTFAMKFGQSLAMLVFTSLAIIGSNKTYEELKTSNDITATSIGLMIVAIVAVIFCVLGAVILFFYREKKVMKIIAKDEDKIFLDAIANEKEFGDDEEVVEAKAEEVVEAQPEVKEDVVEETKEVETPEIKEE